MNKKILITGSNGLLGQKIIALIGNKLDYTLIATARGENRFVETSGYSYESLDITNQQEVAQCIAKHRPDVVINCAAMTNVDQCETEKEACLQLNVEAVKYLVKACNDCNSFFIHLSTDFIFDGTSGPYTETAVPNPISYYGASKWQAELEVMCSSQHWAIVRTVLVYGIVHNMSRSNIILWVKNSLEQGKEINVVTDQWRTPTLAEDLASACIALADKKIQGVFNISGKDFLTPYEMAIKTADYFKLDKSLIHATDGSKFQQTAKRPPKTGFNIQKAISLLNYQPHSFEEGIKLLEQQTMHYK